MKVQSVIRAVPWYALWVMIFVLPVGGYIYAGLTGGLGPDPLEIWHHQSGHWAIWVLVATLAVTPIRMGFGVSFLSWRRHLGLISAAYAFLHIVVWGLDQGAWSRILDEMIKRPHIIIGTIAMVIYLALTITSNNLSIRKLGRYWRRLHWYVHPLAALVVLHHVMSLKTVWEPAWALQAGAFIVLWAWRWFLRTRRVQRS